MIQRLPETLHRVGRVARDPPVERRRRRQHPRGGVGGEGGGEAGCDGLNTGSVFAG